MRKYINNPWVLRCISPMELSRLLRNSQALRSCQELPGMCKISKELPPNFAKCPRGINKDVFFAPWRQFDSNAQIHFPLAHMWVLHGAANLGEGKQNGS